MHRTSSFVSSFSPWCPHHLRHPLLTRTDARTHKGESNGAVECRAGAQCGQFDCLTAMFPLLVLSIRIATILVLSTRISSILSTLLTRGIGSECWYPPAISTNSCHVLRLARSRRSIASSVRTTLLPVPEERSPCHHLTTLLTAHKRQYVRLRVHSEQCAVRGRRWRRVGYSR